MKKRYRFLVVLIGLTLLWIICQEACAKVSDKAQLNKKRCTLTVGETQKIYLKNYKKLSKKQKKKVKWSSTDKKIVTVKPNGKYYQNGIVTARKAGTATIQVVYDKKKYRCKVKVENPSWIVTQYGTQTGLQSMCYTIEDRKGNLILIDGGWTHDADNVRAIIASHGNRVSAWILTHPHPDHVGAFNEIAANLGNIQIDQIYTVKVHERRYQETARDYDVYDSYVTCQKLLDTIPVKVNYLKEDDEISINGLDFKVLHAWNDETDLLEANLCNNGSMCFVVKGNQEKMLFCADVENETQDYILQRHRDDLDVDYVQAGHHGNWGMTKEFYQYLNPKEVFFDSTDDLLTPGTSGFDAGELKEYFNQRGIPVYNFSSAPNQIYLK